MKEHIKSLINRLSNFSQKLDNKALFIDKKWVLIDNEENRHSHIFKRDGKLIMSINGKVQLGTWEYIPEAESILILRESDSLLLNHVFFDKALMLLKYDGVSNNDYFILADQNQIPDLDIVNYLKLLDHKNRGEDVIPLLNGGFLVMDNSEIIAIDDIISNNGFYFDEKLNQAFEYKDGKIKKYYLKKYKSKNTVFLIAQKIKGDYHIGDFVFSDDLVPLNDGKYKMGLFKFIEVVDGNITNAI